MNAPRALALALAVVVLRFAEPSAQNPDGDIRVQPVRGNVYMLVGAGANVTLQVEPPKTDETHDGSPANRQYGKRIRGPNPLGHPQISPRQAWLLWLKRHGPHAAGRTGRENRRAAGKGRLIGSGRLPLRAPLSPGTTRSSAAR